MKRLASCRIGRPADLVAYAYLLVLLLAPPARAGETVDTQALSSDAVRAVKAYLGKSKPALGRLIGIVERGSTGSGDKWNSICRGVEDALGELAENTEVTVRLRGWLLDEINAWGRMATVGRAIAMSNEHLLASLDLIELSNRISKDELKTTTSEIKEVVEGLVGRFGGEIGDVSGAASRIDSLLSGGGLGAGTNARAVVGAFSGLEDQMEDIDDQVQQVERVEYWIRRFGDSIRRRKHTFFKANEQRISRMRRDLAKLVSAKIDPDGRGAFANVESRIEEQAQDNLDRYEKAVKEWEDINKPLLQNAREFALEFVAPAMQDMVKSLPKTVFGVGVPGWAWKPDMALDEAADSWRDWMRTTYERYTGKYYARIAETLSTWEEDLRGVESDLREALKSMDAKGRLTIDDFKEASEKRIAEFHSWIEAKKRQLGELDKDKGAERRDAKNLIDMYTKEAKAEQVALERRIQRHDRRVGKQKADVVSEFEDRRKALKKAISEMKKAKAGVK